MFFRLAPMLLAVLMLLISVPVVGQDQGEFEDLGEFEFEDLGEFEFEDLGEFEFEDLGEFEFEDEELLTSPDTATDNGLNIQISINNYTKFIVLIILAVPLFLGTLYLLVRFIRWAWER